MANITDLTKNQSELGDITFSVDSGGGNDSNINVYEFGNLILADILPTIIWLVSIVSDIKGCSISIDDLVGISVTQEDSDGTLMTISDRSGNSVTEEDISVLIMSVTDLLSDINTILDITGSSLSVLNSTGELLQVDDRDASSSVMYDEPSYCYTTTLLNYDGYMLQGITMDISGS